MAGPRDQLSAGQPPLLSRPRAPPPSAPGTAGPRRLSAPRARAMVAADGLPDVRLRLAVRRSLLAAGSAAQAPREAHREL